MLAAVIGIGSNSVRSLIARNNEGLFERLYRDREGTRLFAGLDEKGMLKPESIRKTAEAVQRMAAKARERGAEELSIVGTEDYIVTSARENFSFVNADDIRFQYSNPEALYTYTEEELRILVDEMAD